MGSATAETFTVTPEQRQELRRRWVEALESGKFTQTKNYLHTRDGYCCLGVGCEVFDEMFPGVLGRLPADAVGTYGYSVDGVHEKTELPQVVTSTFGLSSYCGSMDEGEALTERNDKGATFPEIAALIKSNPPGLFVD